MGLANWYEIWDEAKEKLAAVDSSGICTFGIKPLDDALIGMLKNDLIVIGADSGAGKSQTGLKIALHNAMAGRKVALYFIEGGAEEAIYRIQWDLICQEYYDKNHTGVDMDYRKWRMNMLKSPLLDKIQHDVKIKLGQIIGSNLKIYKFDNTFTMDDLNDSLGELLKPQGDPKDLLNYKYDVDLIIIDHLQYFTLLDEKNELSETSAILKKLNDVTHHYQIPVVLISHLRKKDKNRGLPSQEDFYGTSNVVKIASVAITMQGGSQVRGKPYIYPTFFRFVKSRTKINPNLGMVVDFDLIDSKYAENYDVFILVNDVPKDGPLLNHELPRWATGARKDNVK